MRRPRPPRRGISCLQHDCPPKWVGGITNQLLGDITNQPHKYYSCTVLPDPPACKAVFKANRQRALPDASVRLCYPSVRLSHPKVRLSTSLFSRRRNSPRSIVTCFFFAPRLRTDTVPAPASRSPTMPM